MAPIKHQEKTHTKEREKLLEPPLYKVLLHNDDYTTMEFVIMILESVFHKNTVEATKIMLTVHHNGLGLAGIYPREIAETKAALVHQLSQQHEHPLQCSVEPA